MFRLKEVGFFRIGPTKSLKEMGRGLASILADLPPICFLPEPSGGDWPSVAGRPAVSKGGPLTFQHGEALQINGGGSPP